MVHRRDIIVLDDRKLTKSDVEKEDMFKDWVDRIEEGLGRKLMKKEKEKEWRLFS
jgi:hypothetical protein